MLTVLQLVSMLFLCLALSAVCLFGLLISAGVSLWRLIQRDYGHNTDGSENLKPALDVLYSVALLQGVIFCYRAIYAASVVVKMKSLAEKNGFVNRAGLVGDYLDETNIGCEDNPSFARGRNLITYAVDLMGSNSNNPQDYACGLKVLDALMWQQDTRLSDATPKQLKPSEQVMQMTLMKKLEPQNYTLEKLQTAFTEHGLQEHLIEMQRHTLLEYLILSPSSSHILPRLLQTLDSTSMYDRETRGHAARVVAHLADHIRLEQFPRGILYISSLMDTFQEYSMFQPCERRGALFTCRQRNLTSNTNFRMPSIIRGPGNNSNLHKPYRELVLHGLHILEKLAADEDNCRVISNTRGLLSKIMAPVTSDLVHQISHDAWSDIIYASLQVMSQLVACKGEAGDKLRREMSESKDTISALERILKCQECDHRLTRLLAMEILAQLCNMVSGRRETIIKLLVDILTDLSPGDNAELLRGAGEILGGLLSSDCTGSTATLILQAKGCVVAYLIAYITHDNLPGEYKITATEILEQVCIHYTQDDENLNILKEAMPEVMQMLLTKLLPEESTQIGRVADSPGFSSPDDDIELGLLSRPLEGQHEANPQHGNSVSNTHSSEQKMQRQREKENLQPALFSFCVTTYNTFIAADQDLAAQFDANHACTLPRKLCYVVRSNTDSTTAWLKTLKAICKMIISIIQHREGYLTQDLKSLMEALTNASENMVLIDGSMVFANDDDDADTIMLTKPLCFQKERIKKPVETLASLVKQLKELVDNYKAQELDVTVPSASTSTGSAASGSSPRGFARFSSLPGSASATPTSSQSGFSLTGSMLRSITTGSMLKPKEQ